MTELTSERVTEIMKECMLPEERKDEGTPVPMIAHTFIFNMKKLESHREEIKDMLSQLPEQFFPETGGGYSFLAACNRADGKQWTDFHLKMEGLFAMGKVLNMCEFLLPRDVWPALPGSVPYILVDINGIKKDDYPTFEELKVQQEVE